MIKVLFWILRLIPAIIMLQTLFFKFTAQQESVTLFRVLGMEPWGRIGTGIMELIASICLLIPRTTIIGALLGVGLMCVAIFFHLSNNAIGINYGGSPLLFVYACITLVCCSLLVYLYKSQIHNLLKLKI